MEGSSTRIVYIDFDSCYYNVARKLYHLRPWTVMVNNCNHMISVPHWLEGHFGAKKMTYFVPSIKARIKVKKPVRIFNVDEKLLGGGTPRDAIKEIVEQELSKIKELLPSARLVRKDSIVAECISKPPRLKLLSLPYTIGVGLSEGEAKADCVRNKAKKKSRLEDWVLYGFLLLLMITDYVVSEIKGGQEDEDH